MKLDVRHFFELLWSMTEKELRARYKRTVFGFLWIFINPLIQMLVIGFVFPLFIKKPIANYYPYLFTGLLTWNFFALSLSKAASSIVNERSLIKKSRFPHAVIPISIILAGAINLLMSYLLLIPFAVYMELFTFSRLGYFFIGLLMLLCFTIGASLLTAALNVRFRDVSFFVQALLTIWFYLTPVVYSIYFIPYNLIWIWRLNPLTSIMQFLQHAMVGFPLPGVAMISINTAIIICTLTIGIILFQKESKNFDDWL